MTLDDVYPRLLDALVTEYAGAYTSRADVRESIEKQLDAAAPAERRMQVWGQRMPAAQFAEMKAAAEAATARRLAKRREMERAQAADG